MSTAILTCEQVRAAELKAVEHGISLWALMQKAGQACADVLHAEFPVGRVVVLAGPGNNGGDAFVAAQRLRDLGRNVWVFDLAPKAERSPEGMKALDALTGARQPLEDMRLQADDIVLDGLFGAGLSRPLSGEAAYACEAPQVPCRRSRSAPESARSTCQRRRQTRRKPTKRDRIAGRLRRAATEFP